ncbi:MAG: FAD-binding protein, partial [Candidatus Sungbacteria bacterium]|nr:FAD-binding protein [Candidatus Sungbacteria bacterium]
MVTIRENVPLAPYTYFKIGGPARFFAEARSEEELYEALEFARKRNVPLWVLGGGSNVLIADEGLPGLVIILRLADIYEVEPHKLYVGAGVAMARAVAVSVERGLAGFEWAIGIPGTIGGSVRGNAGCFGGAMKDVI